MTAMIDTVIFDIGNVLLTFLPEAYAAQYAKDAREAQSLCEATFRHDAWQELDRGALTEEEAFCLMAKDAPHHTAAITRMFSPGWHLRLFRPIEPSFAFVRELESRGFTLYYLSNFGAQAYHSVFAAHDGFRLFEGGVASWQILTNKPDPAIYESLIEKYGLTPNRCVFIDDMPANVQAAAQMGFHAIRFSNAAQARRDFEALHPLQ